MTGNEPVPQYGIDRDYPLMDEMARDHDSYERGGPGRTSDLHKEIDAALREIHSARQFIRETEHV